MPLKMRVLTIISFLLLTGIIQGQKVEIFGSIQSSTGEKLSFVSIYQNDNLVAMSNQNGYFSLVSEYSDSLSLSVNMIGFKPMTKILTLVKHKKKYQVDFVLETDYVKLDEIRISEKAINVFDLNDWNILDYLIDENNIFVLAEDIPKLYLYVFDIKGKLLSKGLLETKYKKLFVSCLGGYHLIGKEQCREFSYKNKSINIKKEYTKNEFEKFLQPCQLKYDSTLIFKEFEAFNKMIQFYYYNEDKVKEVIFNIFNTDEANYANSEYSKLITFYYVTVNRLNNDINSLKFYDNIIEDGTWSGDIDDLAITFELMHKVMWFKNIALKKISADIVRIGSELFVFDFENNNYGIVPFATNESKENELNPFEESFKKPQIITDIITNVSYIVSDNREIYKIIKNKDKISFDKIYEISSEYYFPRRISIMDNQLYFLLYDNTKSMYNQVVRKELRNYKR